MFITKFNKEMNQDLFPQVDRVLDEIFNTSFQHATDKRTQNFTQPRSNVREYDDRFQIDMTVPGLEKSDINIKLEEKILIISADKEVASEGKLRYKEFSFGKFSRKFKLPKSIDTSNIKADLNAGILSIVLGKRKEEIDNGPRDIEIS